MVETFYFEYFTKNTLITSLHDGEDVGIILFDQLQSRTTLGYAVSYAYFLSTWTESDLQALL